VPATLRNWPESPTSPASVPDPARPPENRDPIPWQSGCRGLVTYTKAQLPQYSSLRLKSGFPVTISTYTLTHPATPALAKTGEAPAVVPEFVPVMALAVAVILAARLFTS